MELLATVPREPAPKLRWTTPDQWHTTLRYLGDVEEHDARAVIGAVSAEPAVADLGPGVDRLGPHVVVVPVGGLDDLAAAVRAVEPDLGAPPHPDGFRGHLTLARVRDGGPTSADGCVLTARFPVDEIALVRSELHPEGARYTTVTRRRLSA